MIIDVHGHLGEDVVFDEQQTEEQLLDAYKKNGVDGAIIQPYLPDRKSTRLNSSH